MQLMENKDKPAAKGISFVQAWIVLRPFFAIQEGARSVFVGSAGTADQFKVCFSMVRGKDEAMEMGLTAGLGALEGSSSAFVF